MSQKRNNGFAVIIGVGGDLPVTKDDATAIANILRDPSRCAYDAEQVQLLTGENASRDHILTSMNWLAENSGTDDTAIVYFSGHGIEAPDYYLLPNGYDVGNLQNTAISGTTFLQLIRAVQTRRLLVILDCCHAGGFADVKGICKSPIPTRTIEELASGRGRVAIASSRRDEQSLTGNPYSIFTAALIEALAGYGAFEHDGYARVLDLALWVGRKVPDRTGDKQHPIIKISELQDNFAIAWYAGGDKTPRPLPHSTYESQNRTPQLDTLEFVTRRKMLNSYHENLLLVEERMSEYVEFTEIPLTLVRNRRRIENKIAELEQEIGIVD